MNHLFHRNRKGRTAARRFPERIQGHTANIQRFGLPDFGFTLRRLEIAGTEQSRSSFFGGSARNMRHAFEPNPTFRAKHLETESWSCCCECAEITRHAFLHSEEYGCRVVAVDFNDTS